MRNLCLAVSLAALLAGPVPADDGAIARLWSENHAPPVTQVDVAWTWAGIPPCECGGTKEDCPCAAAGKGCPVVPNCTCGCVAGGLCTCALAAPDGKSKVVPEPTQADLQKAAYRRVVEWAEKHPGQLVFVYVRVDQPAYPTPPLNTPSCRYDAGWPDIKTPTLIAGAFHNGQFVERLRTIATHLASAMPKPVPVSWRPSFQPFGGNCRT